MARVKDRVDVRTVSSVGKTREVTPEGYLLCRDVAVARTGHMLYGAGEVPLDDDAGLITVNREADELFKPETLASFEGKAVTNDHPDDWVGPQNWKQVAVGTGFNFRRGAGIEDHLMFADLLITDAQAISDVQSGKVEISLGYDADYTQSGKGKGFQTNILGNHIALVDKGRCGERCKIGDSKTMPKKNSWIDRLRGLKKTVDEAVSEAEEETTDGDGDDEGENKPEPDTKTGDAILKAIQSLDAKYDKRFKAMEKKFKDAESDPDDAETQDDDEGEEETQDDVLNAETTPKNPSEGEQKYTGDSLADLRSRAEILSPGIKLPTLDAANKSVGKLARTCKCNALRAAYTGDNQKMIDAFTGGRSDFEALPVATLDAAFIGASELIRQRNNAAGARSGISTQDFGRAPRSPAEINAANRQYWQDRAKK